MNNNQLSIQTPEGHEIDVNNSDLAKGIIKFKPLAVKVASSWSELGRIRGHFIDDNSTICPQNGFARQSHINVFKTEKQALASLALSQLSQLKADVNGEWVPEWSDGNSIKHVIKLIGINLNVDYHWNDAFFLAFKDKETATQFLE